MTSLKFVVIFDLLLLGMGSLMAVQGRMVPALSIFGALGFVAIWQIVLASITDSFSRTYRWEPVFRPTHYVQAVLHLSMYAYLGTYWPAVGNYAPLLLTQIFFGYLCDMLIAWTRGRTWHAGAGILPIVFSTNLFLWFREPVFYWQFVLIFATFLGKEVVTWNYGGRRRHIVNPSALSLSAASVIMLATGTSDWSHAVDIATAFDLPPNFFEVIFLLGLVVQSLFLVTPTTFGAALTFYLIHLGLPLILGGSIATAPIHAAVFLGMTFLVTDPATSPRAPLGRFFFGCLYAIGVTILFVVLRSAHEPSIFDKLLIVPVVNLLVPLIDRTCDWIAGLTGVKPAAPSALVRFSWLAAYMALFWIMLPSLKAPPTQRIMLLPLPEGFLSPDLEDMIPRMIRCRRLYPEAYEPFGFAAEITNSREIRQIYRQGSVTAAE